MKILLTGATGFIGSFLAEELIKQKHEVRAIVRNPDKLRWPINDLKGLELVKGDLTNQKGLDKACKNIDIIIHAAGVTKALKYEDYYLANAKSCEFLINAIDKKSFKQFIFFSTMAVSGSSKTGKPKTENEIPDPISNYGITKLKGEEIIKASGINYTILRFCPVYGERDTEFYPLFKTITKGFKPIIGKDNKRVNMLYVMDLIKSVILSINNKKAFNEIINISDGIEYSWLDINNAVEKVVAKKCRKLKIPGFAVNIVGLFNTGIEKVFRKPLLLNREKLREMKEDYWIFDIEKAKKLLGFKPEFSLEQGLKNAYNWYIANNWLKSK